MQGKSPVDMIDIVAEGLDDILMRMVFVGGAVASLYYQDPAASRIRPTLDVDCVLKISSRMQYNTIEDELRNRGFRNDMRPGAPICRWIYEGVTVDVMLTEETILGFSNRWYDEGIDNAIHANLPSGREIRIFSLPYFIAAKIEAFKGRGGDFRFSHDIEDVVMVLDAQLDFDSLDKAPVTVKNYLKHEFASMAVDGGFLESVSGYIGYTPTSTNRARRVVSFMSEFGGV